MNQSPERTTASSERYIHHIMELAKGQVRDTPEYVELRSRGMGHPEAFKKVAHAAAHNPESPLSEADRSLLMVTGSLGEFIQAQHELNTLSGSNEQTTPSQQDKDAIRELKREYIIPFQHLMKEFVNTHPTDEIAATSSALANTYSMVFSRYPCLDTTPGAYFDTPQPSEVYQQLFDSLNGMRHEVAAESLLDVAGFEYDHTVSTVEDANGSDIFVYIDSEREGIDIKASAAAADKNQDKYRFSKAVWTGLTPRDFTGIKGTGSGMLSIPYATALEKSDAFAQRVRTMVQQNAAQRAAIVQRTAERAVQA